MTEPCHIARALLIERRAQGIKQCVLATEVGVARDVLLSWEKGRNTPHLHNLEKWAAALGFKLLLRPTKAELMAYEG